jgi:hypothetical protein
VDVEVEDLLIMEEELEAPHYKQEDLLVVMEHLVM